MLNQEMGNTKQLGMALTLKNQLKLLLEQNDMTAAQLSRKSGVSQQVLSIWLRGGEPKKMSQVKKVADIFGVTVDVLCFSTTTTLEVRKTLELDALLGEDQWISGLFEVRFRRVSKRSQGEGK